MQRYASCGNLRYLFLQKKKSVKNFLKKLNQRLYNIDILIVKYKYI